MASNYSVNIKCTVPVIEFMVNRYGKQPIEFPKKDRFNTMISFALQKPPADYKGEPSYGNETLKIMLPFMEYKNVDSWNYLSPMAQADIASKMKAFLKAEFHSFMDDAKNNGFNQVSACYMFMEQNDISPVAFDMFKRERNRYLQRIRERRHRHKITSDRRGVCPDAHS
jgi:hypothetical protein